MKLVDRFDKPGGYERVTGLPVWRVRDENGQEHWFYLRKQPDGSIWLNGQPTYPIERRNDATTGFLVGAAMGAGAGAAIGGAPGALIGAILGGVLTSAAKKNASET